MDRALTAIRDTLVWLDSVNSTLAIEPVGASLKFTIFHEKCNVEMTFDHDTIAFEDISAEALDLTLKKVVQGILKGIIIEP